MKKRAEELQKQNRKAGLPCLLFSFMQCGVCSGILEIRICAARTAFEENKMDFAESLLRRKARGIRVEKTWMD